MLALPMALRQLIDHGLAARDSGTLNLYFIGFLAAAGAFGIFAALRFYLVTWVGERVVADLRAAVYRRVVRMDPLFFETTRVGEVLSRLTTDTTLVQAISGVNLSIILRSGLSLIGALVLMGLTSARLMGVILVLIPAVVVPLILTGRRVRGLSRASQDRVADTSGLAGETLNAIQTVQAFTLGRASKSTLQQGRGGQLCHRGSPHPCAGHAHGGRHYSGVCRYRICVMARRATGVGRLDELWTVGAVFGLRCFCRLFRSPAHRDVGRNSTRRGRDGASGRIIGGNPQHRCAAAVLYPCRRGSAARFTSTM